jgi:hypothetical protein
VTLLARISRRLPEPVVLWTLAGRLLSAVGALAVVPLVVWRLQIEEQGLYYLFASLVSAQVLLELGFATVVVQRIAAAVANNTGDPWACGKTRSFTRLVFVWYGWIAAVLLITLLPIGWWYLSIRVEGAERVLWTGPWTLLVVATSANVVGLGLSAILEGIGKVAEMVRIRTYASLLRIMVLAVGLVAGCGLWSLSVAAVVAPSVLIIQCLRVGGPAMRAALRTVEQSQVSWSRDVWPFQWRIALSWMSGFFIFQFMILAVGDRHGAAEAGRFGLGVQIASGISALASSWITPWQATWSNMVATQSWPALDAAFRNSCSKSTGMALLGFTGTTAVLLTVISIFPNEAHRLPTPLLWLLIGATAVTNQPVFAMATYLRAHGKEPYLITSIYFGIGAIAIALLAPCTTVLSAFYLGLNVGIGIWALIIFLNCRRLWHLGSNGAEN